MKILCFDAGHRPSDFIGTPNVIEGVVYNSTGTCSGRGADGTYELCYTLEEFDRKYAFDCDRFIPLSDISETEMERNYILQVVPEIGSN